MASQDLAAADSPGPRLRVWWVGSNDVIQLTERECQEFISAILNPPEPSVSLKAAVKRYFNREIRQL
jgi:hypothetical protein